MWSTPSRSGSCKEFYDKYKQNIIELLKYSKKAAFIEVLSEMKHYWAVKHEFQGIDSVGGGVQLSTVQLDVADAERYGIVYVDHGGQEEGVHHLPLVHRLHRAMDLRPARGGPQARQAEPAVLDLADADPRDTRGRASSSPDCEKLADRSMRRVDIDDTDDKVGKKIRNAEMEWINMIIVLGDKERASGQIPVRMRSGEVKVMTVEQLKAEIERLSKALSDGETPAPAGMLSKRPVFRGIGAISGRPRRPR